MAGRQRSAGWAASAARAGATDLDPGEVDSLSMHPQVQLLLAANPRTPLSHVVRLLQFDDLFVRRLASVHPARDVDDRIAAAMDPGAPAWVGQHLLRDPSISDDVRARVHARSTSSDVDGDPDFDPVACVGSPGVAGESEEDAYRRFAGIQGNTSSLWRSRLIIVTERAPSDEGGLAELAVDSHEAVRAAAQRVAAQRAHVPARSRLASVAMVLGALAILPIAIVIWMAVGKGSDEIDQMRLPSSVDLGTWRSDIGAQTGTPLCEAGGTTVWRVQTTAEIVFVITASVDREVTVTLVSPEFADPQTSSVIIEAGAVGSFVQRLGESGSIRLAIGESPDEPIEFRMGSAGKPGVSDADGDC